MSVDVKIARLVLRFLLKRYYRIVYEAIVGEKQHIHLNPKKKVKLNA